MLAAQYLKFKNTIQVFENSNKVRNSGIVVVVKIQIVNAFL